jgi:hemolysin activation/secretion protein
MRYFSKFFFSVFLAGGTLIGADVNVIREIVLIPNQEALKSCDLSRKGVINCDVAVPGDEKKLLDELKEKYLGHELTQEEMVKIKRAIIRHYRAERQPAVDVQILLQKKGRVAFIVTQPEFLVEDPRWTSKEHLEQYIAIGTSVNIGQDILLNNVDYLNRNPFRRSIVAFPADSEDAISDLKFISKEKFPVRIFLGGDNSGTKFTGRARLYGGLTWGHVFGLNDVIHYQYSCNPDLNKFQSHYGTYIAFLPWKNILTVSGLYETTDKGKAKEVCAKFRYTVPLEPISGAFIQEGTMGIDYKNINSNRLFIETAPIRTHFVNVTQLYMNYSLERSWKKNVVKAALEVMISPGKILSNQESSAYNALRPHAKNRYIYVIATAGDVYQLPHQFSVAGLLRLQVSTGALLPTEQYGLGGYNTVRGYHERAFNADQALCVNGELRAPSLSLIKKWKDELIFLAFIDYGLGLNLHPSSGNPSSGHLIGIGPGVRYQIDTHLSIRGDWGFRFHEVPGTTSYGNVAHLGIVGLF